MNKGKKFSGRSVAVSVLKGFDGGKGDVGDLLGGVIGRCEERGKATDIVYGVVRNRELIDRLLGKFGDVSKERVKGELLNVLRVGVYEIVFCPGIEVYAAVNEAVSLGRSVKQRGFVNAVLRNVCRGIEDRCARTDCDSSKIVPLSVNTGCLFKEAVLPEPVDDGAAFLSAAFSLPVWLVAMWIEDHGYEPAKGICFGSNRRAGVYLMPNTLKISAAELADKLGDGFAVACDGKMVRSPGGDVASFDGFDEGLFSVQDPTAAGAVEIIGLTGGETVVDLCAAPGGKTVRMAQIMGDKGLIIATDADSGRLEKVRQNCGRLGISCVKVVEMGELDAAVEGLEVDAVLADVPCSNTGVMARRCEVRHRIRESICDELFEVQLSILEKAAFLVREGGKICYSTCSIMRDENAGVLDAFLKRHSDFEFAGSATTLTDGIDDCDGGYFGIVRQVKCNCGVGFNHEGHEDHEEKKENNRNGNPHIMIRTTSEVYEFVREISKKCRTGGHNDIASKFDEAMSMGSSALEILGAIKSVVTSQRDIIERYCDAKEIRGIIDFIDTAYGGGRG